VGTGETETGVAVDGTAERSDEEVGSEAEAAGGEGMPVDCTALADAQPPSPSTNASKSMFFATLTDCPQQDPRKRMPHMS